jgi:hypothetical protein
MAKLHSLRSAAAAAIGSLIVACFAHADEPAGDSRSAELEEIVWNALADSGTSFTSIQSVECTDTECEIRFTGVDDWPAVQRAIFKAGWDGHGWPLFKQGGGGRRGVYPGSEITVWTISTRCPTGHLPKDSDCEDESSQRAGK